MKLLRRIHTFSKQIMLPPIHTQHYLVLIRLQRKISFVTSLQFLSDLKSSICMSGTGWMPGMNVVTLWMRNNAFVFFNKYWKLWIIFMEWVGLFITMMIFVYPFFYASFSQRKWSIMLYPSFLPSLFSAVQCFRHFQQSTSYIIVLILLS